MDTRDSCLNPTDLDVLIARIRAHAAVVDACAPGNDGSETPFSCRFKGMDKVLRQDIDVALAYQAPYALPAAGRLLRIKAFVKNLLRRLWSWQTSFNASVVSATVGLNDKTTALVVEIETLEKRIRELEARLDGGPRGDTSDPESGVR
jgi:hypothetical protein